MTDTQLLDLVYKMRQAQKAYEKNNLNRDRAEARRLEKEVDHELSKRSTSITYTPPLKTGNLFGR